MAAILDNLSSRLRILWLAAHGIGMAPGCRVGRSVRIARGYRDGCNGRVSLGEGCQLETGAVLDAWGGGIALGPRVFVGPYSVIYGQGGVEIGEWTLVSMHCSILSSNHAVPPPGTGIRSQPDTLLRTKIGRDVWLGAGVTVLGGVTIGDGCVIGAGAVVSRDLPPFSVAVGVPARVLRQRT